METVNKSSILGFLQQLGEKCPGKVGFYLLGGSALCLLGNPRTTIDIDYTTDLDSEGRKELDAIVLPLAKKLHLDVESVPIHEFIPLPPESASRRIFFGKYGNLDVYIFDLYSISLSKIARGFDTDIEDVQFLVEKALIKFDTLERFFNMVFPAAQKSDIDPKEFSKYFEELRRRLAKTGKP